MGSIPSLTRRQFNMTSLAAVGLSLTGLGGCDSQKPSAFRIGVLSPKTGSDAQVGLSCEQGAKVAATLLTEKNLDIQVIYADTESSVEQGRTKAEKLIAQGCHLLIGAHNSAVTSAIAQVCEQRQVPLIINISAAPKITQQGYQYVFRNFPTTETLAINNTPLMKDLFKATKTFPKTAAILYTNDTYGEAMYQSLKKEFALHTLPFQVLDTVSYDHRTQDLSAEINRIKASKAELLIPITRLNDAILMIRECVKQRYQPLGIISPGSPGMYEKQFYQTLGPYADHCIINTAWYNPLSPLTNKAIKIFNHMFPQMQFDLNVAFTCEAVWLAADVYQRANATDGQSLRQALLTTNLRERLVYGGPLAFDKTGQALNIESVSLQNHQGKPMIVFPHSLQQTLPIFPMLPWKQS